MIYSSSAKHREKGSIIELQELNILKGIKYQPLKVRL